VDALAIALQKAEGVERNAEHALADHLKEHGCSPGLKMPLESELIRAKTQQTLIDFLHAELKLGPTFVRSALLALDADHMDHFAQAKTHAIKAAESIRRFMA
jgi:hypothetical protein